MTSEYSQVLLFTLRDCGRLSNLDHRRTARTVNRGGEAYVRRAFNEKRETKRECQENVPFLAFRDENVSAGSSLCKVYFLNGAFGVTKYARSRTRSFYSVTKI